MVVPLVGIACILLAYFSILGQCCTPAEIGQEYTITSTETNAPHNKKVTWNLDTGSDLYNTDNHGQPNAYPDSYTGTTTQLTILNVSINDGSKNYRHTIGGAIVYTCTLYVYKRACTPTCEPVTLTGNHLRTTCTTAEVYPKAKCQFTLENGEMDRKNIPDGTYIQYSDTDPQPRGNTYYSTSCTLQYPVEELKPGNWTVQVTMYPDLTGVSLAQGTMGQAGKYFLSNYSLTAQPEKKDLLPLAALVGGAVGAVVVIAVVVVGVIFYIRRATIDNPDSYNTNAFKDNSELDGNAAAAGYNPHEDPTAVFTDNSELYATASKGYNPHEDPTAVLTDNSELYATASKGYNPHQDTTAVFIDNSELYATASKGYNPHQDPTAVFTDNSELYATASKGYNPHEDPTAVFIDNSELYATSSKEPSESMTARNDNPEPTVTSAEGLSETYTPETGLNPYDDIDQEEQKREQELFATKSKTQATTETPGGPPQYSISNEDEVDLDAHTWI